MAEVSAAQVHERRPLALRRGLAASPRAPRGAHARRVPVGAGRELLDGARDRGRRASGLGGRPIPIPLPSRRSRGACGTWPSTASTAIRPGYSVVAAPTSSTRRSRSTSRRRSPRPKPPAPRSAPACRSERRRRCSIRSVPRGARTRDSTFLALMLHALDEVIHHSAEIALAPRPLPSTRPRLMADDRVAELLAEVGLPAERG